MFSRSAEYAIRAMTFLAAQPAGKLTGAKEISEAERIPMAFLWKVLHNLTRRRLVRSFKGVRGGYELARPAAQITVQEIVETTDGLHVVNRCVLGLPECNAESPCPLHSTWSEIRGQVRQMLEETNLAALASRTGRHGEEFAKDRP